MKKIILVCVLFMLNCAYVLETKKPEMKQGAWYNFATIMYSEPYKETKQKFSEIARILFYGDKEEFEVTEKARISPTGGGVSVQLRFTPASKGRKDQRAIIMYVVTNNENDETSKMMYGEIQHNFIVADRKGKVLAILHVGTGSEFKGKWDDLVKIPLKEPQFKSPELKKAEKMHKIKVPKFIEEHLADAAVEYFTGSPDFYALMHREKLWEMSTNVMFPKGYNK